MARQYAVLHVSKLNISSGGIGAHIDRKHIPHNTDETKKHLNKEYVSFPIGESLKQSVDSRISEGYTATRKIRKDAVKAVGVVLSGSHEQLTQMYFDHEAHLATQEDSRCPTPSKFENWVQANKEFAEKKFGKENIIRFTLHMDERTPHIHVVFTPIAKDGRLHYKSFINGKNELKKLQDDYAEAMGQFKLHRGRSADETQRKHQTTAQWYAEKQDLEVRTREQQEEIYKLSKENAKSSDLREENNLLRVNYEKNKKSLKTVKKQAKKLIEIVKQSYHSPNEKKRKEAHQLLKKLYKPKDNDLER